MYPRNAASPERIAVGAVLLIADGTVQTTGVAITVRGQGGAEAGSAGTIAYGASGIVYYTPTQAETNFTSFTVIASKASCIPVAQTVVTTATAVAGTVDVGSISGDSTAADNAESFFDGTGYAGTGNVIPTVTTLSGHTPQTGDNFARLGAPAGASVSADVAAVKVDTAATLLDTGTDGVVVAAASKTGYSLSSAGIQAVWDALTSALTTAGSIGKLFVDNLNATVSSRMATTHIAATAGKVDGVALVDVTTTNSDMRGTDSAATAVALATVDNEIAVIDGIVDDLKSGIIYGAAATGTLSTTQATTNLTGYADDQLIGRVVIWLSGNAEGEASAITDYASASGLLTFDALTTAPANGDTLKIV